MSDPTQNHEREPETVAVEAEPAAAAAEDAATAPRRRLRWASVLRTFVSTLLILSCLVAVAMWLGRDGWLAQQYGARGEPHDHDAPRQEAPAEVSGPVQVMVTDSQRVLANIRTEAARATGTREARRTVGRVVIDTTAMATQTAWVDGRIERLYVRETGQSIRKGERVASIYSPELLEAQQVLLTARTQDSRVTAPLVEQARHRLELLGMSRAAIARLEETGRADPVVSVHATASGTVTARHVEQGQYVTTGQVLFEMTDLTTLWIEAEVYERDLHLFDVGTVARIEPRGGAHGHLYATVAFVHPVLDDSTRTARVRFEIDNADATLRPNQIVDVSLEVRPDDDALHLAVPSSAVVRTGGRPRVWVETSPGLFEARMVELGGRLDDRLVVSEGLRAGDDVVISGTFLVDSQATLEQPAAMRLLSRGEHPFHRPGGLVAQPGAMPGDRTICPVMENEFTVTDSSPHVDHDGGKVFFCCGGCDASFVEDPEGYLARGRELVQEVQ